jgi:hypothetical protein
MKIHNIGEMIVAAALASEASGQRGNSYMWARIARQKTRVNALVTLALNRARRRAVLIAAMLLRQHGLHGTC